MNTSTIEATRSPHGHQLMGLIAAEWTKLWSVRATWWSLAGALALMALYTASAGFDTSYPPDDAANMPRSELMLDAGDAALGGLLLAQFAVISLVMLAVTSEHSTGSIRSTLQWNPRRGHLVAAKAAVLLPVTLLAGAAIALVGAVLAYLTAGDYGTFVAEAVASDIIRIGVYLGVISAFTIGVSMLLRSSAGTLTTIFLLLLLLPMLLKATGLDLMTSVAEHLPGSGGMQFLGFAEGIGMGNLPYGRGFGLALLTAWAVVALVAGYVVLRRRDA